MERNYMNMKKIFIVVSLFGFIYGCSTNVDTSNFTAQEHLQYAQKLLTDGDYEEAVREYQSILLQYSGTAINDDAQYFLGMAYFKREQYILAAYEFSKLIRDIPTSTFVQDAQFMLAESYYKLSPNFQLDQSYTKKAIQEFQAFIEFFPTHPKVKEAEKKINELNLKLAHKEFHNAEIYERMEYYNAAMQYYTKVYETYHDTKYAPDALFNKIKILVDKKHYTDKALREIAKFLEKYPNDPRINELKEIKANLLNSK